MSVVKNLEDISICRLTSRDVVRHPLVQKIVKAYEAYENKELSRERTRPQQRDTKDNSYARKGKGRFNR